MVFVHWIVQKLDRFCDSLIMGFLASKKGYSPKTLKVLLERESDAKLHRKIVSANTIVTDNEAFARGLRIAFEKCGYKRLD